MAFYPLAATLISAVFAATLFAQYRTKGRPYLLAWTVALFVYAIAALTEVIGAAIEWNTILFRIYYFFGGILVVGVLALGTTFLLSPRRGGLALRLLVALAAIGLVGTIGAALDPGPLMTHGAPPLEAIRSQGGIFNIAARAMAALINIIGSLVLIGGALWSAYALWRKQAPASRLAANVLIAAGAFIAASTSSLYALHLRGLSADQLFYVGQAVGVLVMYAGFIAAQRQPARAPRLTPVG